MMITPTTKPTNRPPVVGNVPADAAMTLFLRQRAGNRHGWDDHPEAADKHRDSAGDVIEQRVGRNARKGRAVIAGARNIEVEHLREAVRPCIVELGHRLRVHRRHSRPAEIHQRQYQNGEHRHLDFLGFDLLADIFRRAANHQAGDENRNNDE